MKVWLDGDACPREVKEIVFRASERRRFPVTLVANKAQVIPRFTWITQVTVPGGMDVADAYLVAHAEPTDLVVTQDVPLAAELVAKGVTAMSPRGETFTEANVAERLSIRDFLTEVRAMGGTTGGPPPFDAKAKQAFANAFDRWLAKHAPKA
jgi:uncharacterized protein YaiI (UPF0178 family)